MDQEVLVTQLRELAKHVDRNQGPVALFLLLATEAGPDQGWNVVVSAKGLDRKSRANAVRQLTEWLRADVEARYWPQIARTTILRTDDPFVRAFTSVFRAEGSVMNLQNVNVNGIEIPSGILLESKRVAA
jgi:hypothetical protein